MMPTEFHIYHIKMLCIKKLRLREINNSSVFTQSVSIGIKLELMSHFIALTARQHCLTKLRPFRHESDPCFRKRGLKNSSISIAWELLRSSESPALPWVSSIRIWVGTKFMSSFTVVLRSTWLELLMPSIRGEAKLANRSFIPQTFIDILTVGK